MYYFMDRVVRSIAGFVNGYSSHLISIPGLRLSMVVMSNSGQIDTSRFLVPAAKLLIPLIENQLTVSNFPSELFAVVSISHRTLTKQQAAGPNPPPNATIFQATFSGVVSNFLFCFCFLFASL